MCTYNDVCQITGFSVECGCWTNVYDGWCFMAANTSVE